MRKIPANLNQRTCNEPINSSKSKSANEYAGFMRPNTAFLLMAQYNGAAVVPLEFVCRDYFRHLTVEKLLRKILRGEIALPIIRIEKSQKAAKGVYLADLADYLDKQRERALKECRQLSAAA